MGGEGAWSGGRGFVSGNPRQIKQFHTPRYTVEQCAADCQRFAGTAAHHDGAGAGAGAGNPGMWGPFWVSVWGLICDI